MDLVGSLNSPAIADRLLCGSGVSLDRALLPLLVRINHRGPIGVADLATLAGRDHTTVSRQVAKLHAAGLIDRQAGSQDLRVCESVVTADGHRAVRAIESARNKLLREVLADWSKEDRVAVSRLTRKLADALSPSALPKSYRQAEVKTCSLPRSRRD